MYLKTRALGFSPQSLAVLGPDALLHGRARGDAVDPLEQVRELVELLLAEAALGPALDPRPRLDVGHRVLALALAGEVLAGLARVLARQPDLEHAPDPERLVVEAVDGV